MRLDPDLKEFLEARAEAEHRSLTNLIETLLLEYRAAHAPKRKAKA